jgi:hypothetical protein
MICAGREQQLESFHEWFVSILEGSGLPALKMNDSGRGEDSRLYSRRFDGKTVFLLWSPIPFTSE